MTLGGILVFYFLLVVGKILKHYGVGPQWLRHWEIGKHTMY